MMASRVDAATLKAWLSDADEIALVDVREYGSYGEGHLFFAVSLPYSRFELGLATLVPNPDTRLVLCGFADEIPTRAALRAEVLGYRNVHVLLGGVDAWKSAGYTLYAGVNVPSKAFGELVEQVRHTPRITARDLEAMRQSDEDMVIIDGRTFTEFHKMNIPGGICCPNGELALRIGDLAPRPETKIIINCAGRTRSIIGAQTLIDIGVPNPVFALENGTQGWFLAGLPLENGALRCYGESAGQVDLDQLKVRARSLAEVRGVAFVSAEQVNLWLADSKRTTYLLDVRTPEEFSRDTPDGFAHAPGGQLVQATDHWLGTRGARVVLLDDEQVRAPITAHWLRQMGYEAYVLEGGLAAARLVGPRTTPSFPTRDLIPIDASELAARLPTGGVELIDVRPSISYRKEHLGGAKWSIRPRVATDATDRSGTIVIIAELPDVGALAAIDLFEAGFGDVRLLSGGHEAACAAGLPVISTPNEPPDADCVDFLFFTHGRHEGNAAAARKYLAWETGLLDQLDAQERQALAVTAAR